MYIKLQRTFCSSRDEVVSLSEYKYVSSTEVKQIRKNLTLRYLTVLLHQIYCTELRCLHINIYYKVPHRICKIIYTIIIYVRIKKEVIIFSCIVKHWKILLPAIIRRYSYNIVTWINSSVAIGINNP